MKKSLVVILLLIVFSVSGQAQSRMTHYNNIGWFTGIITPKISEKFSAHIEYQCRRVDWVEGWQQNLLRVGLNYKFHPQVTAHIGYAWILTFPYGEHNIAAVGKVFPEHRMYEQLVVNTPVGKVSVTHRLRIEQRWIGKLHSMVSDGPDEWVYLNRVRYMPRVDVPLSKKVYAAAYDEILIGFGKNVGENIFDQNRICGMIGYKFTPTYRMEAGVINQTLQLGREVNSKNIIQSNSGFVVNAYLNIN